jgi:uncharacterized protein YkwD
VQPLKISSKNRVIANFRHSQNPNPSKLQMKSNFLGTFCALASVISLTATTARADISTSIPAHRAASDTAAQEDEADKAPPTPAVKRPSTPAPVMNSIELETFNLVNKYRQSRNLPLLVADPAISAEAKAHSERMARSGQMSHDGFNERVTSVSKTIIYRKAAENVAYNMGYGKPDLVAVQGWIESPGHQRNMVGPYDLTGIGVAKNDKGVYYFTQIFIRKAYYVADAD